MTAISSDGVDGEPKSNSDSPVKEFPLSRFRVHSCNLLSCYSPSALSGLWPLGLELESRRQRIDCGSHRYESCHNDLGRHRSVKDVVKRMDQLSAGFARHLPGLPLRVPRYLTQQSFDHASACKNSRVCRWKCARNPRFADAMMQVESSAQVVAESVLTVVGTN